MKKEELLTAAVRIPFSPQKKPPFGGVQIERRDSLSRELRARSGSALTSHRAVIQYLSDFFTKLFPNFERPEVHPENTC